MKIKKKWIGGGSQFFFTLRWGRVIFFFVMLKGRVIFFFQPLFEKIVALPPVNNDRSLKCVLNPALSALSPAMPWGSWGPGFQLTDALIIAHHN